MLLENKIQQLFRVFRNHYNKDIAQSWRTYAMSMYLNMRDASEAIVYHL